MIILYAEDDPEDAEVFRDALKSIDTSIGCIVAKDGIEALHVLENSIVLPDFIFLDVNMPMLDGRECLIRIKGNKTYSDIPVIMYTTSTRANDMKDFKNLGATEYFIKPNTFSDLYNYLKTVLSKAS
jgi:CheY-like chemotaxis protein